VNAANCYEQLTVFYPEDDDYKVYYAQALYQACLYEEAMRVTVQIENPELQGKVKPLLNKFYKMTNIKKQLCLTRSECRLLVGKMEVSFKMIFWPVCLSIFLFLG
jgi:hypothetical protein